MSRIAGYTYKADTYCPGHIVGQLTTNPGDIHHEEHLVEDNVEEHLALLAKLKGIKDLTDEYSYDSDDFPKVFFADQVSSETRCAVCNIELG